MRPSPLPELELRQRATGPVGNRRYRGAAEMMIRQTEPVLDVHAAGTHIARESARHAGSGIASIRDSNAPGGLLPAEMNPVVRTVDPLAGAHGVHDQHRLCRTRTPAATVPEHPLPRPRRRESDRCGDRCRSTSVVGTSL